MDPFQQVNIIIKAKSYSVGPVWEEAHRHLKVRFKYYIHRHTYTYILTHICVLRVYTQIYVFIYVYVYIYRYIDVDFLKNIIKQANKKIKWNATEMLHASHDNFQ